MDRDKVVGPTRRQFLQVLLATPVAFVLAACGRLLGNDAPAAASPEQPASQYPAPASPSPTAAAPTLAAPTEAASGQAAATAMAQAETLSPTPACTDDDDVTPQQTEGPFYTPDTPQRTSLLEADMPGTLLVVTGQVLATDCRPVAGALLDFWHADDNGVYDNAGYRLRGHQFADEDGRYHLETILPGLYPGRTRHIHVKVQAPNQPVLTTQLYFPNEPDNNRDGIFQPELLMAVQETAEGQAAAFNFVLEVG